MTDILTKPWKVNPRNECVYVYAPGEVCIDLTAGMPEDRARVLALVGQAQRMAALLKDVESEWCNCNEEPVECGSCHLCRARVILRDAGLMSGPTCSVEERRPGGCAELCDFEPCRKAGRCDG